MLTEDLADALDFVLWEIDLDDRRGMAYAASWANLVLALTSAAGEQQ